MSLFAFDVYDPRRTKYLAIIPFSITVLYTYAYFVYCSTLPTFNGFYEWVASPQLQLMMEILAIFSFLPGTIFLIYTLKKRNEKKGTLLSSGFFTLAIFVYLLDNLSIQPPNMIIRRVFILAGLSIIWFALRRQRAMVK